MPQRPRIQSTAVMVITRLFVGKELHTRTLAHPQHIYRASTSPSSIQVQAHAHYAETHTQYMNKVSIEKFLCNFRLIGTLIHNGNFTLPIDSYRILAACSLQKR